MWVGNGIQQVADSYSNYAQFAARKSGLCYHSKLQDVSNLYFLNLDGYPCTE